MIVVVFTAHGFHVLSVNEQVRSLTWARAMMNCGRYLLAPNTVNNSHALRVQTKEPLTKPLPSWMLVEHPHFVTALGFIIALGLSFGVLLERVERRFGRG